MKRKDVERLLIAAYRRGWEDGVGDAEDFIAKQFDSAPKEPYTSEVKQSLADDMIVWKDDE